MSGQVLSVKVIIFEKKEFLILKWTLASHSDKKPAE